MPPPRTPQRIETKDFTMNKLQKYMWDFGTDSLQALVEMVLAESAGIREEHKKALREMVADLTEGLREYGMNHNLKDKVADYR